MNKFLQPVFLLCALGFHATVAEKIVYAEVGEDISLDLPSYEFKYYLFWKHNNVEIASFSYLGRKEHQEGWKTRLTLSSRSLLIRNVTQADFGVFSCSVRNQLKDVDSHVFRLIQITVAVEPPVLLPGERLSLTCAALSQDHTQIHWVGPQRQREEGKSMVQVWSSNSGLWTCVVSGAETEKRVQRKVTVIDLLPPAPGPTLYTSALTPLTVPCSLAPNSTWDQLKSKGVREVGWNFCPAGPRCEKSGLLQLSLEEPGPAWKTLTDRAPRPSADPSSGNWSLGRSLAREEDAGDYECFVRFQNGVTLNRTVRVEVLRIVAEPGTALTTGQQLNLTCTTARSLPPDLHVQWVPPTDPSSSGLDLTSPRLTFRSVQSLQNGTWRCQLQRGQTVLTSARAALNIEPQLSVWKLVTLCAAAVILILLVILVVILLRRRQRRTRRHVRLCQCKNPKPKGFYRS